MSGLERFYQWAKEKGHYQAVAAVERHIKIQDTKKPADKAG